MKPTRKFLAFFVMGLWLTGTLSAQTPDKILELKPESYPLEEIKADPQTLINEVANLKADQIRDKITRDGKTRWQTACWIYALAFKEIKDNPDTALALLKSLIYEWRFPSAMIHYGKIIYATPQDLKQSFSNLKNVPNQDKQESFILLNLAFDMTGMDYRLNKNKAILDAVVNRGLGLNDSLYGDSVNKRLNNPQEILNANQQRYISEMKRFSELYLSQQQRAGLGDADFKPVHWQAHNGYLLRGE